MSNASTYVNNLVNFLAYNNTNKYLFNSTTINNNDGDTSLIDLTGLYTGYVFNDYKVDETNIRTNNPISISGSDTTKTLTSTLEDNITVDVVFNLASDDKELRSITVTYPNSTVEVFTDTWTKSGNQITINLDILTGATELDINVATCTTYERIYYPIIVLFLVLSLLIGLYFFLIKDNDNLLEGMTATKMIIMFIFIILTIIFIQIIADQLASRCTL